MAQDSEGTASGPGLPAPGVATEARETPPLLTVGIGASAGGIEALEQFFDRMRADSGIAFIVVQHLSPDFKSLMDEIIARHTGMPVKVATDGMVVERNHVYVNPAASTLGIREGRLRVTARDRALGNTHPIDAFLRELAADARQRSAAIILSGTGTDGAQGIGDVKRAGGWILAQEPRSAQFDGMPQAAIATGLVDMTLSPEQMPTMLVSLLFQDGVDTSPRTTVDATSLKPIIAALHDTYGLDFGEYRLPTLLRRTQRRVVAAGCADVNEYASLVRSDANELDALYRDLLIGVTQFFRDTEVFDRLAEVLPELLAHLGPEEEFRAWVAGCATGEEAYSIAMVLREAIDKAGRSNPVKIFATDVHREALRHAAVGLYREASVANISAARRDRFFLPRDAGHYQVSPALRSMIVFAPHNLLQDVPFNRLDLVSCRNLLIYLEVRAQKRAISTFHFSLKQHGLLLLGPSESLTEHSDAFETVDPHWKIFRRLTGARSPGLLPSFPSVATRAPPTPSNVGLVMPRVETTLVSAYHGILDAVMPAALLVGPRRNLLQTFGGASRFLRVPEGRATDDVTEMVESDLRVALAGALGRVFKETGPIRYRDLRTGADPRTLVDITVRKIANPVAGDAYALVSFDEQREIPAVESDSARIAPDELTHDRIGALETELHHARENLQSTIEALETSNEELQATNEELMASNEELQTTNEELHSVNQELFTVNTEFQKKIAELTQITTDMDLLFASTDVHTLFLDRELRVRRFTPKIAKIFNLVASDLGRRIDAFNHRLSRSTLYDDLPRVLATGNGFEEQVRDANDAWFLIRVLPYRREGEIDGVVVTLIDITQMKRLEADARSKKELLSNILLNSPHPVFVRDRAGRFIVADESFRKLTGRDPAGLEPEQVFSVDVAAMLTRDDPRILGRGETIETEDTIPTMDGPRTYLSVRFPMRDSEGSILGIGGIFTDVTSLKRAETEAREASNRRDRFLAMLSHELRNPLAAVVNAARILTRGKMRETELERWHHVILERSHHMTRLVEDLLDVARLTQDKLVLERAPMDLVAAAKGVVDEVSALFQERGITLTTEFAEELPLLGDATRLHQLQVNLLTNAARHTPKGGFTTFQLRRRGDLAEISVADSGEGIAPDMLGRIFDLFVQGDAPGARGAERGLGVGLALVRRIAELHGGSVSVASKGIGAGSEFRVTIPLGLPASLPPSLPPRAASEKPSGDRPRSVLVVDDDAPGREAMSKLLEIEDVEVRAVAQGTDAITLLASSPRPDLVLLDIGLPGMDGHEVCRRLRALPDGDQLLIFALTGFGQDADREASRRAGFDGHLTKPVDVDDVFAMYRTTVRTRQAPH